MSQGLSAEEIRKRFLEFFEQRNHRVVPSSSLVPRLDPTLLFSNAGMNQFKTIFTGEEKRDYVRAASAQKCVRAGGKHNDLENVGRTARHHTFFEMMGNFSFGDYFKKEAIQYAWEFVTKTLKLDQRRLYVSVYQDDDEAFAIWRDQIGLDPKRIFRFGAKDNFWAMGETGPCGPCSELFFDQGPGVGCGKSTCTVGCDCDRYIEFWNLVFMEFEQRDGARTKLPKPSIDTGMGLERMAAIVQGVTSNYDTDLFKPILEEIGNRSGHPYSKSPEEIRTSIRVVADHIRAIAFLITDGVQPSNEGRGYVLRRIMRRAMRHGRSLGFTKPFLVDLVAVVANTMGSAYPELKEKRSATELWVRAEEEAFAKTIDRGLELLSQEVESMKKRKGTILPGEIAFRLYDTYGFPVDMTADILREQGLSLDQEGFDAAFEIHREKARGSWKGTGDSELKALVRGWVEGGVKTEFLGYRSLVAEATILKLVGHGRPTEDASTGDEIEFVTDRTPFYGESGGQVGDIGAASGDGFSLEILDTQKPSPDLFIHKAKVTEGTVKVGQSVTLRVDEKARAATAKNHTATHLLHAALKGVLGSHVQQKGSLVSPERLRFDFAHPRAVSSAEIQALEQKLNEQVWMDTPVTKEVLPYDQALASGAVALFDEKYGSEVRVVSVGDYSKELCGGTHLDRTADIGLFKIIKESSVAAGVRRLEALTGYRALRHVQEMDARLREIGTLLGSSPDEATARVEKLVTRQKELEKELKQKSASGPSTAGALTEETLTAGVRVAWGEIDADQRSLRDRADREMERLKSGVVVIGSKQEGKAFLVVKVSKDLAGRLNAGTLVQSAAKILGGSGGGRPDMAQAGGTELDRLGEALSAIVTSMK